MSSRCRACVAGVEHCHGTVIHHILARTECTEPDCRTPEVVHAFSVDCEAIGCMCARDVSIARVI
ncbi:hypothetical protein ACIA48_00655 [Mycobacterium sp. NPDC051804]|uniref:hypothetical protein n=1 Tax=Mycobacterium sp. NPDC051804 TaxID=3364295 RepID=UPI00379CCE82